MPLFQINGAKLSLTRPTNFNQEKEIQALIEKDVEKNQQIGQNAFL